MSIIGGIGVQLKRHEYVGLRREVPKIETGREDADHHVRIAPERNGLTDNLRVVGVAPATVPGVFVNSTNRSGSGNGAGFSNTELTTEKIAVLVPIPSVRAATAAAVKPGLCRKIRSECRMSWRNVSMTVRRREARIC